MFHQKLFGLLIFLLPLQLARHFWPPSSYVFGLRIDYLSPTLYLTDILTFLIFLFWFIEKSQSPKKFLPRVNWKSFFFPFSVFAFLLLGSWFSGNPYPAFYKLLKVLEFTFLGFYIVKSNLSISEVSLPLSGAVIYSSFIAVLQFFKQSSLNGFFWWLGERTFNAGTPGIAKAVINGRLIMRPYATFPHPNALAGFILISLILTLPSFFKINKLFTISYLLLAILSLVVSFSRSVWFIGLLVVAYLVFVKREKKPVFFIIFALLTSLLISKLFFNENQALLNENQALLNENQALLNEDILLQETISQRLNLNQVALQMIEKNPLKGVGLNNFIPQLPYFSSFWKKTESVYWLQPVHNIFLLIAAETGLIGLVLFLWFLFLTYRRLFKANEKTLIVALTAILFLGLFDHYWLTLQQTQLLFSLVLGLVWSQKNRLC